MTGTGTNWKSIGIKAGDIFTIDDTRLYQISMVNTNTSLTLKKVYAGPTISNQSYTIIRNFASTLASDVAASQMEINGKYEKYIDADLTKIKGERGNPGLYYKGNWVNGISYEALDVVMYNDNKMYISRANHVSSPSNAPATAGTLWVDMELVVPSGADVFNYDNAGLHNSIYRGKNLGNKLTDEQSVSIRNGSFKDLFVGDYWVIGGVTWRIADFDYYLRSGDTELTTHHAVIVPDGVLYSHVMNETATTEGGYVGSKMHEEGLNQAEEKIKEAFGEEHVLKHQEYLVNAVSNGRPSGVAWYDRTVDLMTEQMVYGCKNFAPMSDGTTVPHNYTVDCRQLNLFRHRPDLISNRGWYWLRDVVSLSAFAHVTSTGRCYCNPASLSLGVRPAALIY